MMDMSDFINALYHNHLETGEFYFFNAAGEITSAKDVGLVENKVNITKVLGQTGEEILAKTKGIKIGETEYFKTKNKRQIIAVSSIPVRSVPALDWYITAVCPLLFGGLLQTGMTVLFGVMMAVIFFILIFFNIFSR
jgi:hypothetical protein